MRPALGTLDRTPSGRADAHTDSTGPAQRSCQTGRVTESRKPAVVRGFAASSLAIFVALAGHVSGGGQMPGPLGILVPWVFSFMICVLLAGRSLSLVRLGISVAVSQFLFHTLFVLGTITPSAVSMPHVHGAPLVLPPATGIPEAVTADASMWLGHALAALLTVAALHRGERLLLLVRDLAVQLVRWLRHRVDHALILPVLRVAARLRGRFDIARVVDLVLLATLRGRAPPLSAAI
ncbi:hypothetical protein CQ040_02360 [Microbacterium sp. MYb54]|nr:hypothetical protein CQ032_00245 [Microbacterium sp. MYb43]PQZ82181.1 hypothetical protein CQ031_01865 [Microbacterium sp. MYb40]PRB24118.1 hypothetical protein CQ040_02360 [Microbacterium sp. MYb54]PRB70629.1 hypothetical protein CQ021_00245 [Microbacterium sp. MYb24]PRB79512.1 hypothetical protein CQ027_00245 [Microbacterium sp. MYb32]